MVQVRSDSGGRACGSSSGDGVVDVVAAVVAVVCQFVFRVLVLLLLSFVL